MLEFLEKFLYILLIVLAVFVFGVQCGIAQGQSLIINELRCINAADY